MHITCAYICVCSITPNMVTKGKMAIGDCSINSINSNFDITCVTCIGSGFRMGDAVSEHGNPGLPIEVRCQRQWDYRNGMLVEV